MEEIALVFSSLAGACTAVAIDKIPRRKSRQVTTVSSAVDSQLHSLGIEKEILAKTITRLYNDDSNISRIHRDKLLTRYQHQLGAITAKIEKLEAASRYPDLGPVGDSIITLMDTKLSRMDQKLHEISSKISTQGPPAASQAPQQQHLEQPVPPKINPPRQEPPSQIVPEKKMEKKEEPPSAAPVEPEAPVVKVSPPSPTLEIHPPERRVSVELSTLTTIPHKMPEFPAEFIKPAAAPEQRSEKPAPEAEVPRQIVPLEPTPLVAPEKPVEIQNPLAEKKIQLRTPVKIPEEEKIEDDDKDLDKIKNEIMRALSKLEQVEVE